VDRNDVISLIAGAIKCNTEHADDYFYCFAMGKLSQSFLIKSNKLAFGTTLWYLRRPRPRRRQQQKAAAAAVWWQNKIKQ